MKRFLVVLLLFVASSSFAQTCPVMPTNLNLITTIPFQPGHTDAIWIQWKNVSDKATSGVSFKVAYYAMNEVRELISNFEYNRPTSPSKKTSDYWDDFESRTPKGKVWVNKVAFKDGTTWEDDGSKSCSFEYNK